MVETDGTVKSQIKVMNLDDGSSFLFPGFFFISPNHNLSR